MGKMKLRSEFLELLHKTEDIYDLIAVCFNELLFYVPRAQAQFITGYIDNLEKDKDYQAYAPSFIQLRTNLTNIFLNMNIRSGDNESGYGYSVCVQRLIDYLQDFSLPEGNCPYNRSMGIVLFFVLKAMDYYVYEERNILNVYQTTQEKILNKNAEATGCFVYYKEDSSFLDEAYRIGESGFRKPLRIPKLGEKFSTIQIISKHQLIENTGIPAIVYVRKKDNNNKIRICYIPFIGFHTFSFHEKDAEKPCGEKEIPKGLFYVEYSNWNVEEQEKYMITLVQKAIENEAHIIVFPEFIMSPALLTALKEYLNINTIKNAKKSLQVVIAGSTYEKSEDGRYNNVSHILSARGVEIGKYFKYSPYCSEKNPKTHGLKYDVNEDSYLNCEMLDDPGMICTIVDVEGVGRILPAICRDVIDGEYTLKLSEAYNPSMIIVPAWSTSVKSFDTRILSITDSAHSAALLCNCCNAVSHEKNEIGTLYLPEKVGSIMKATPKYLIRKQDCIKTCKEKGGCLFLIDIAMNDGVLDADVQQIHGLDIEFL